MAVGVVRRLQKPRATVLKKKTRVGAAGGRLRASAASTAHARKTTERRAAGARVTIGGVGLTQASPSFERLRAGLRLPVERGRWSGVAACVFVDGRLQLLEEAGMADIEARTPMKASSIVRLYSMTKCIIAAAVMQLADEGLLGLDDLLSDHIPAFKDARVICEGADGLPDWERLVPARRPIRIRHLLTHTSGISGCLAPGLDGPKYRNPRERAWAEIYGPLARGVDRGEYGSLAEWVDELAKLPLVEHPGVHYEYGYSYDVLGRIVEVRSGMKLAKYLQARIFGPLGMKDTCFDLCGASPGPRARRLATLYRHTKSTKFGGNGRAPRLVRVDPARKGAPSRWAPPCKVPSGGGTVCSLEGGLLSTLDDYARFLLAATSGGKHPTTGARILSPKAAEQLLADQTRMLGRRSPASTSPYDDLGLGLSCLGELQRKGAPSWGCWFDGVPGVRLWGGAASTCFKYDPNGGRPILVMVMTQTLPQEDGTVISAFLQGVRDILSSEAANR
mmetsp:Transcript_31485/g.86633  ORF Transcript_31485/g.86633 Transcript_31485/m.86633 type:complete len:505 (-) Transcript_31485:59-1573(-)